MKLKMFSIWDTKMECYGTPFFISKRNGAMRFFADLAKNKESAISRHPMDYVLFELGEFDDESGIIEKLNPVSLGTPRMELEDNSVIDMRKLIDVGKNSKEEEKIKS